MGSRQKTITKIVENIDLFNFYKERLINLALSQFKWDGFPDSGDADYFERCLLFKSKAAFYVPRGLEFIMTTGFMSRKNFNSYGYPVEIYGVDFNGVPIETDDWVILYDNKSRTNILPKIELYASLLAEVHSTIRSNLAHQRKPYVVPIDKTDQLSYDLFYNQVDQFAPFIKVKKTFDIDEIKTLDLQTKYIGNDLFETLRSLWAEALSILGITSETSKKERLIKDEIDIDRQEDTVGVASRLLPRLEFAKKVNNRWGLNLSVKLTAGGEKFGIIYDGNQ